VVKQLIRYLSLRVLEENAYQGIWAFYTKKLKERSELSSQRQLRGFPSVVGKRAGEKPEETFSPKMSASGLSLVVRAGVGHEHWNRFINKNVAIIPI